MRNDGSFLRRRLRRSGRAIALLGLIGVLPVTGQNTVQVPARGAQGVKTGDLSEDVRAVGYAPDGKTVAGGGSGKTVKVFDVQTGRLLRTLTGHTGCVYTVAYAPDGTALASGGFDKLVRLWDPRTGELKRTFPHRGFDVHAVAFSTDSSLLAIASMGVQNGTAVGTEVQLCDVRTGEVKRTLKGDRHPAMSLAFFPDGKTLATAEGVVKIWDIQTGELKRTLKPERGYVRVVAVSADKQTLAGGGGYTVPQGQGTVTLSEVRLWNVRTGELQRTLTDLRPWLRSVGFSPDGKVLAVGTSGPIRENRTGSWVSSELKLWDARTGDWQRTIEGGIGEVNSLAFSPDGKRIVCCDHEAMTLIDTRTGDRTQTLMTRTLVRP
jgi:WD40 repeat protein